MPNYVKQAISKAFKGRKTEDKEFVIWDEKANNWLLKNHPIYTSGNEEINIGIGIIFWRWNVQKWTVK